MASLAGGLEVLLVFAVLSLQMAISLCRLLGYDNGLVLLKMWRMRNYILHLEDECDALVALNVAGEKHRVELERDQQALIDAIALEISADLSRVASLLRSGFARDAVAEVERLRDRVMDDITPAARSLYAVPDAVSPAVAAFREVPVAEVA